MRRESDKRSHQPLKQQEYQRNNNGAHHGMISRQSTTQHMLSHSQNICLKLIKPKKRKQQETDGTHHLDGDDAAILSIWIIIIHQFFLRTTAERAGR